MQNAELRQAQEELTAARDRYLDLYDFAPVGYLTISVDGRILQANLTCAGLLGIARHDLINKPLSRFIAPRRAGGLSFSRQRLGRNDAPQTVDLPLIKADGTTFWARLDAVVARETRDAGGQETPVYRMTITDITDRKQAEEARERHAAELDAIIASMADGLVICDPAGDVYENQ